MIQSTSISGKEHAIRRSIRISKRYGEDMRTTLLRDGLLDTTLKISPSDSHLYFPLKEENELTPEITSSFDHQWDWSVVDHTFIQVVKETSDLMDHVKDLPVDLRHFLPSSFDVIGDICIVKLNDVLTGFEKYIGNAILLSHQSLRGVFRETTVSGKFRIRSVEHIAGDKNTTTMHTEYGLRFKIDVAKAYFSPRLAGERHRIAELISTTLNNKGRKERVLDMFAGVGPFSLHIARSCPTIPITAVDLNPDAILMLRENIRLNKITNIDPIIADARNLTPSQGNSQFYTQIIMNLPHNSLDFMETAARLITQGDIHLYTINAHGDLESIHDTIRKVLALEGRSVERIVSKDLKGYSPSEAVYVHDIEISG